MNMVVGCAAYEGGHKIADLDIDHLDAFETGKGEFVWIGLHEPSLELLQKVQKRFGLHELCDRGRAARPSAAEARGLRRVAVHGAADGAARGARHASSARPTCSPAAAM